MPGTLPSRTGCGTLNHIWVLAINPDAAVLYGLEVGVIGAHPGGAPEAFEVRAFATSSDSVYEDPVTGSLNASLGQWLIKTGQAPVRYRARQGTRLGRHGVVHVEKATTACGSAARQPP